MGLSCSAVSDAGALARVVRDGLFLAASRTYAEQYVEPFVRAKYGLSEPLLGDHDGVDDEGLKYEIKACKVLRASVNRRGSKSLLERIVYETDNVSANRAAEPVKSNETVGG